MAYCNECGAYIPDGHSKCLACGLDRDAAAKAAESAARAEGYNNKYNESRKVDTEFLRRQLEEQRRRQQENSRKWAETERAQRQKAQHQKQSFDSNRSTLGRSTDNKKYQAPETLNFENIMAGLSYFGMLFVLPYLLCKESAFAKFHAKQGMILFLATIIFKAIASIFGLAWAISIVRIYFMYKGIKSVLEGKQEPLPYIGTLI